MCTCVYLYDANFICNTVVEHVHMVGKVTLHCEAAITVTTWRTLLKILCTSKPHLPPDWSIQPIVKDLCEAVRTKLDACLGIAVQLQTINNDQVCSIIYATSHSLLLHSPKLFMSKIFIRKHFLCENIIVDMYCAYSVLYLVKSTLKSYFEGFVDILSHKSVYSM